MAGDEEPELPLEPTPAINWRALRRRAYLLVTAPKLPAWAVILLLVIKEVPGWKSRYEFWLAAAKSLGGMPGTIASVIASNYFAAIAGVMAAAYIVLVGEPKKGTQRHHWWPYIGWSVFGLLLTSIIVTGIVGYVEIYIKEEVSSRDEAIQKQYSVHPVFWHLTDFQKTNLGVALDQVPEDKRFQIQIRCLQDSGSRTFAEDFAKVVTDNHWKVIGNCLFNDIRPDLVGLYLGIAKKHAGKAISDLPEHVRTLAKLLEDARIDGQWGLDKDDALGDEGVIIIGNPPSSEAIGSKSTKPSTSP
jgi:hypothetical protein